MVKRSGSYFNVVNSNRNETIATKRIKEPLPAAADFVIFSYHKKYSIVNEMYIKKKLLKMRKLLTVNFCRKMKEKKNLLPKPFKKSPGQKTIRIHHPAKYTPIRGLNKECTFLSSKNVGQFSAASTCC